MRTLSSRFVVRIGIVCGLALLVAVACVPSARAQACPLDGLDEYIQKGMRDWQVPGLAVAHLKLDGKIQPIPLLNLTNVAAAGAIFSNAVDMAQWVRFQLSDGTLGGARLLNANTLTETHMPQIFIPREPPFMFFFPESNFSAYGLGWMLSDYHGHQIIQHPGDTDGMASLVALMPDQKVGLVILTNLEGPWLRSAVMYRVMDAFLGNPQRDWNAHYLTVSKLFEEQTNTMLAAVRGGPQIPGTKPSVTLEKYAGEYANPRYGPARVDYKDGRLWLELLGSTAQLDHWNYDTFSISYKTSMPCNNKLLSSRLLNSTRAASRCG